MSDIIFIRHAQAGSRNNYDVLSDLGKNQATLLGEHLSAQQVRLAGAWSGTMRRQRETAEIVCDLLRRAGLDVPEITAEPRLNEFSLAAIYRAMADRMIGDSPEFARDFEEMQAKLEREPHTTGGAVGRCDRAVINAWIQNRYDYDGESWSAFRSRVGSLVESLPVHNGREAVAIFTSATPIAVLTGIAMGLSNEKIVGVAGVLYNSGITAMRLSEGGLRLFTMNATPHLPDSLRTFR